MASHHSLLVFLFLIHSLLSPIHSQSSCNGQCQVGQRCSANSDCSSGLYCASCIPAGVLQAACIRSNATPTSRYDFPFNKYSWLTTHNSFAISSEKPRFPVPRVAPVNQEDSVTSQLQNGVRGLMLDFYDFKNDVWECHSFGGKCYEFTAFRPAVETLQEVRAFLSSNPNEVITIFIEDYVQTPNAISRVLKAAGLDKYLFPLSKMPRSGTQDWPTLSQMIADNQRLIVFTSKRSKEASEGIAYQWKYTAENQYGDDGMRAGNCTNRAESPPLASTSVSLVVVNYFRSTPIGNPECKDHGQSLYDMLDVCGTAAGSRYANFLAVNFYKKSQGGGVFQGVDTANSKLQSLSKKPFYV